MKISKKQLYFSIASIIIIVASLVLTLLNAYIPWNLWGTSAVRKALFFVFCIFAGFGIMCITLAFNKASPWFFFLGSILVGLAVIYALSITFTWWINLIILLCIFAIGGIVSFIVAGNKTESIALNKSPDFKNYQQRTREKLEKEALQEEKPLPKLKSFKE